MSPSDLYHANALSLGIISKTPILLVPIQRSMEHQTKSLIPKFCILWCRKIFICISLFIFRTTRCFYLIFFFHVYLVVSPIYCGQQFRIFLVYMYNLSYQNYLAKSWNPKAAFMVLYLFNSKFKSQRVG